MWSMRRGHRARWTFPPQAALWLCGLLVSGLVWALQRTLESRGLNYPDAPIVISHSEVVLIAPDSTPVKVVFSDRKQRQPDEVYYLTRKEPGYFLKGRIICRNTSAHSAEALQLAVVLLDALYNPVQMFAQPELSSARQLTTLLPAGTERTFHWEQKIPTADFVAVAVAVTRARLSNGTVWQASNEELIDIF